MTSLLFSSSHPRKVTQFSLKKSRSLYTGRAKEGALFVQTVSVVRPTDMQSGIITSSSLCACNKEVNAPEHKYSSNNENQHFVSLW